MATSVSTLTNAIDQMAESFKKSILWLDQLAGSSSKGAKAVAGLADETVELGNDLKKIRETWMHANDASMRFLKSLEMGTKDLKANRDSLQKEIDLLIKMEKREKEAAKASEFVRKIIERETETREEYIKRLNDQAGAIKGVMSTALEYGKVFGAQGVSLEGMVDKVTKYNQGIYDLTRTQKRMGSGTKDVKSALDLATKSTYMSQIQTVDFANSMGKLYVGVRPTTTAFVNLASVIQREFGPSIETTIEKGTELMGVQSQYPALFDSILEAHKKMVDGMNRGDQKAIDSAQALASSNMMNLVAMGASVQVMQDVMRLQDAQADGEDELAKLNQQKARNMQTAEDAILKAGKTAEGAMNVAAKVTGGFLQVMKGFPAVTMAASAGFGVLAIATNVNILALRKLIAEQIKYNAVRAAGAGIPGGGIGGPPPIPGGGAGGPPPIPGGAAGGAAGGIGMGATVMIGAAIAINEGAKMFNDAVAFFDKTARDKIKEELDANTDTKSNWGQMMGEMKNAWDHPLFEIGRYFSNMHDAATEIKTGAQVHLANYQAEKMDRVAKAKGQVGGYGNVQVTDVLRQTKDLYLQKDKTTREAAFDPNTGRRRSQREMKPKEQLAVLKAEQQMLKEISDKDGKIDKSELLALGKQLHGNQLIRDEHKKSLQAFNKEVLAYVQLKANAEARLKIDQQVTDALNQQYAIAQEFGTVDAKILAARTQAAKQTQADIQDQINQFKKIASMSRTQIPVDIELEFPDEAKKVKEVLSKIGENDNLKDINAKLREAHRLLSKIATKREMKIRLEWESKMDKGGTPEERAKKQEEFEKAINKAKEDGNRLSGSSAEGEKLLMAQTSQRIAVTKALVDESYAEVYQQQKYNSIIGQTLGLQRQVMEAGQYGLGASVQMMQKQVDLAYENIKQFKEGDIRARERLVSEQDITKENMDQIDAAQSMAEWEAIAEKEIKRQAELGHSTEGIKEKLVTYAENHHKVLQATSAEELKIYELTKEVREGYLSAMKQMAVGSSQFSKIIGTQTRGAKQLMDIVENVEGKKVLNTQLMGGTGKRTALEEAGRGKAAFIFTATGARDLRSEEEQKRAAGQLYVPPEARGKPHVGAAGKEAATYLKEAAAKKKQGETEYKGESGAPRDLANIEERFGKKNITTAKEAPLPAEGKGIELGADVTAGSQGTLAPGQPARKSTKGEQLTIPPAKGKDKVDSLIEEVALLKISIDSLKTTVLTVKVEK